MFSMQRSSPNTDVTFSQIADTSLLSFARLEHVAQFIHMDLAFFPIFYDALVDMSSLISNCKSKLARHVNNFIIVELSNEREREKKLLEQSISTVASAQTLTSVEHVAKSLN